MIPLRPSGALPGYPFVMFYLASPYGTSCRREPVRVLGVCRVRAGVNELRAHVQFRHGHYARVPYAWLLPRLEIDTQ